MPGFSTTGPTGGVAGARGLHFFCLCFFSLCLGHVICDAQQPEILEANCIICACQDTVQCSVYTCHINLIYIIKAIEASVHGQALISFLSRRLAFQMNITVRQAPMFSTYRI